MSLNDLTNPERRAFENFVREMHGATNSASPADALSYTLLVLRALEESPLSASGKADRAAIVLKTVHQVRSMEYELASAARSFGPALRNEIAGFVSDENRRLVYQSSKVPRHVDSAVTPEQTQQAKRPASSASPTFASTTTVPAAFGESGPDESTDTQRAVLLLGATEEHEGNRALLRSNDLLPLRVTTLAEFGDVARTDVCAIVVASGWWKGLPEEQHPEIVRRLLSYSTLAWFKMDCTGLNLGPDNDIFSIVREARIHEPAVSEMNLGDSSRLTQTDVSFIKKSQRVLFPNPGVQFIPSDISEHGSIVLSAAAIKCVRARNLDTTLLVRRMRARFVPGGRTNAKVALLELDDGGATVIAKVDSADRIRDEAGRFLKFIARWDRVLHPTMHVHAGCGAIVFSLVADSRNPAAPAPTAEVVLAQLATSDDFPKQLDFDEDELCAALSSAAAKLAALNRVPCPSSSFESFAWLGLDAMKSNLDRKVQWTIWDDVGSGAERVNVVTLLTDVERVLDRLNCRATVHGDAHLRNVLVRDRECFFIDYAFSGPGHPCFDLVRLSLALLVQALRSLGDERELAVVLRSILVEGASYEDVLSTFPAWLSSVANRVALRVTISCRSAALNVLGAYGGGLLDYCAVFYAMSCQALFIQGMQLCTARAVMLAVSGFLRAAFKSDRG